MGNHSAYIGLAGGRSKSLVRNQERLVTLYSVSQNGFRETSESHTAVAILVRDDFGSPSSNEGKPRGSHKGVPTSQSLAPRRPSVHHCTSTIPAVSRPCPSPGALVGFDGTASVGLGQARLGVRFGDARPTRRQIFRNLDGLKDAACARSMVFDPLGHRSDSGLQ